MSDSGYSESSYSSYSGYTYADSYGGYYSGSGGK